MKEKRAADCSMLQGVDGLLIGAGVALIVAGALAMLGSRRYRAWNCKQSG